MRESKREGQRKEGRKGGGREKGYLPASPASTMMGSSSSSDTRTAHTDELYKEFIFEKFNDI